MNTAIEHLSKNISPETSGIIWLTDSVLSFKTSGVYEFNYLLDGILLERITEDQKLDESQMKNNFFLGKSFGKPLFVAHSIINSKDDLQSVYTQISMAIPLIEQGSIIHIYNRSKNTANINILKILSEKYQNYQFKNLNI